MRSITSDDWIMYNGKARGNNEPENGFYTFLFLIKCYFYIIPLEYCLLCSSIFHPVLVPLCALRIFSVCLLL